MDWETYQREIKEAKKEAKETASFLVSYNLANWLENRQSMEECLNFDSNTNKQIVRISSILDREYELKK